ncbi:hypothetical protein B6I21_08605 [candidate division KSB1 bacterium 4572_119]|nr:MAG: hypothetical protein B6I21_08605 [candidate division KSB1 bacterium 4572_119]
MHIFNRRDFLKINFASLLSLPFGLSFRNPPSGSTTNPSDFSSLSNKSNENEVDTRFGFIPIASFLQKKELDQLIADYIPPLENLGGQQWNTQKISDRAPLFYFVVTGGTEQKILNSRANRFKHAPAEPVYLIAHPGNNSLPAALEVLGRLQQDGEKGNIFYLNGPNDKVGLEKIKSAVFDLEVKYGLQESRIGLVGAPSDWLVASSPNPATVQKVWGPEVVPIELNELYQLIQTVPNEAVEPILESLLSGALELREPSQVELKDAVRVYLAMKQLVTKYNLDAITLRCFDLILKLKTTGCFALAQLNDEGIPAGCEGDLVSTLGMLLVHKLIKQNSWMANPAQVDISRDTFWMAHCTVAKCMVKEYKLRSHFESGLSVGIQGRFPSGPVTVLRIGGKAMDKIWLAEGEILQAGDAKNLCRTQVEIKLTHGGNVKDLLQSPLGNHLVMVQGNYADRIRSWWETLISS